MNRNAKVALACVFGVALMVGAAFASVPLYRLFCQVTGFDGTTQRAIEAPDPAQMSERQLNITFDTNVRNGLPWSFEAEQTRQTVHVGETAIAFFRVTNTSDRPIAGIAAYNVVPESAGPYFLKLQCFCFEAQTLQPGQTVEFPVQYFIDESIETEAEGQHIRNITLSYTYYPVEGFDEAVSASSEAGAGPV